MTDPLMQRFYPESRFGGFTDFDGTVAFYLRVNALAAPHHVVVDFGCGQGAHATDPVPVRLGLRVLKGKVSKVIGLDVDPRARAAFEEHYDLPEGAGRICEIHGLQAQEHVLARVVGA
jgi:hypothetical protein